MNKYKRVLLKLSGEALAGDDHQGFCTETLNDVARQIHEVAKLGIQIGIVVGAGNIWRGRMDSKMNRSIADDMGMTATLINALALKDYISRAGTKAEVLSAVPMDKFAEYYTTRKANDLLNSGCVCIFACGTGNPYFTTDTAAVVRALEVKADILLQAKNIDAVYDSDPAVNKNAKRYHRLNYDDVIKNNLKAMDLTASALCRDNDLASFAFGLGKKDAILRAASGENNGTYIKNGIDTEFYE